MTATKQRRLVVGTDFQIPPDGLLDNTIYIVAYPQFEEPMFIKNTKDHGKRGKKGKANKDWNK